MLSDLENFVIEMEQKLIGLPPITKAAEAGKYQLVFDRLDTAELVFLQGKGFRCWHREDYQTSVVW